MLWGRLPGGTTKRAWEVMGRSEETGHTEEKLGEFRCKLGFRARSGRERGNFGRGLTAKPKVSN